MKKYLISTVIALIAILLCACSGTMSNSSNNSSNNSNCNNSNLHEDIDLDRIFEVGGQYADDLVLNHKNIISASAIESTDNTVLSERKVSLDGIEYSAKYRDTLYYAIGDKRVHRYFVNDNEKNAILIDGEGNIQSILYKYIYLNVSKNASPDKVLELLKPELNKVFDLSFYENIDMPEYDSTKTRFGFYDYLFYNIQNGYITDYFMVSVADDGGVCGIKQHNLAVKDFTLDINKDKEKAAIEAKLKDIHNTDSTEYISFESYDIPVMTIYDGQICVRYHVSADYLIKNQDSPMSSFVIELLIPLDLISN